MLWVHKWVRPHDLNSKDLTWKKMTWTNLSHCGTIFRENPEKQRCLSLEQNLGLNVLFWAWGVDNPCNILWWRGNHCVPPLPFSWEASTSYQIFKKGGLHTISIFRGRLLGKRRWPFSGGSQFLHKLKKKINWNLKYLRTKKIYKQKCFLCHH